MGKGGQRQEHSTQKQITWDEVQGHASKDDQWLVIEGQAYNVTSWARKHPGGPRLLGLYAGQDATEAFNAFHNDLTSVKKFLKPLHMGAVEDYKESEIKSDFKKVKEAAIKMGLFKPSVTFFTVVLTHVLLLEVFAYYTLVWFGTGWISFLVSMFLCAAAQVQAGWTQHDIGHLSVFNNTTLHHVVQQFLMTFFKGASASWWNHMHYQHHAKPNVIGKDPDVRIDALFVVGEEMPIQVAKERKKSMPFNWQHRYFFALGPPILFPVYFQIMLFRHIFTRKLWMEFSLVMLYFVRYILMTVPILGWGWATVYYFLMRCVESHWFTWVAQSNHIPMHIKQDEENPWLKLQMNATCDIKKSFFNDWFTGHLNFQIEHHLFPTMPRHNLYKVAPLVKSLCEKHQVPYVVKGLWESFVDIVKHVCVYAGYYHYCSICPYKISPEDVSLLREMMLGYNTKLLRASWLFNPLLDENM